MKGNLHYALKKRLATLLVLPAILVLAVLVVPVSGGLTIAENGAMVTATDGATSPVIQITNPPIDSGGTIVIDVSQLQYEFLNGYIEDANMDVSTTAPGVTWEPEYSDSDWTVTLTSSGGSTAAGDNVTVTFRGSPGNPWLSSHVNSFTVPVTPTNDPGNPTAFNFAINTPAPSTGLSIAAGDEVTTPTGATSPVITVISSPIDAGGNITIDLTLLKTVFFNNALTTANIGVQSMTADPLVSWSPVISADNNTLTLTSSGGSTATGDTITVTFRGTAENPWNEGLHSFSVTATRGDTHESADFEIWLDIAPQGGLTAADGEPILTTTGNSSAVITITNQPVAIGGNITINTTDLNAFVVGGTLKPANVEITDNAAAATWTGTLDGNNLTLTSTGGPTEKDETIVVTFTGAAGSEWIADTGSQQIIPLTATRTDTRKTGSFNLVIDTGGRPVADFSASPLTGMAPATVTFTDNSSRSPVAWNWSFGDGTFSEAQNTSHSYATAGLYTVSLNATNSRGWNIVTKTDYIDVFNGAVREANTSITGLTITNCGGPQTVTVDTSLLKAALIPNNSVLEVQPDSDRGFKNITFYAFNGAGFTQNSNLITGNPTSVRLVSEEIPPPGIFSDYIGAMSSFNYSTDLRSYPCNALLTTNIRESIAPEINAKLLRIANGNTPPAVLKETAYTAKITKTNFPSSAPVTLHMSVNQNWRILVYPQSDIFIWHLADDEKSGQILPTDHISTADNLDYFVADSPRGMSTFGISAFTGNNNPFQLITFALASVIGEPQQVNSNPNLDTGSKGSVPKPATVTTTSAPENKPASGDPGKTAKVYTNNGGTITQATTLQSADSFATLVLGLGVVAKDRDGKPLSSVTITRIPAEMIPAAPPGLVISGADIAYELQPEGSVFSPGISLIFTAPPGAQSGQDFTVKSYDRATGTWQDVPSTHDPGTGTITAQVTHFSTFALFVKTNAAEPPAPVTPVPSLPANKAAIPAPSNAMSIVAGMFLWLVNLISANLIIVAVVIILVVAGILYHRKQNRDW